MLGYGGEVNAPLTIPVKPGGVAVCTLALKDTVAVTTRAIRTPLG